MPVCVSESLLKFERHPLQPILASDGEISSLWDFRHECLVLKHENLGKLCSLLEVKAGKHFYLWCWQRYHCSEFSLAMSHPKWKILSFPLPCASLWHGKRASSVVSLETFILCCVLFPSFFLQWQEHREIMWVAHHPARHAHVLWWKKTFIALEEKYAHNQAWCCGIRGLVSLNLSASKLRLATKHVISKDWSQNSVRSIHASTAPEISRMHCTRVRVHTLMHAFSHSNTQCALVQHMKT